MPDPELDEEVQELLDVAKAREELPEDQRQVFDLIMQADLVVEMETVNEMIRELDRAEAVGPLLSPGEWRGDAFEKSNRALERLRALREFKQALEETHNA